MKICFFAFLYFAQRKGIRKLREDCQERGYQADIDCRRGGKETDESIAFARKLKSMSKLKQSLGLPRIVFKIYKDVVRQLNLIPVKTRMSLIFFTW